VFPPPVLNPIGAYLELSLTKMLQSLDYTSVVMVEAGGVEPPSEKRNDAKPTCLAQFSLVRPPRSE
jgi:hypothetical protein